jgi:adenosylcobinamide-GDP ribazoletransferase
LHDLKVALVFLTRLPIRLDSGVHLRDLAASVHMFPIAGVVAGVAGSLAFAAAHLLGLPSLPAALIAIAAMIMLTGALHEDGLADTADAFAAGADRERALQIMRDSRIGTYGTIAVVLVLLGRLSALSSLWDLSEFAAIVIAAAALSRSIMPLVMLLQPSARESGLAASTGKPERGRVILGLGVALALCVVLQPASILLPALLSLVIIILPTIYLLGQRFGGCTGDTLGAIQQIAEVVFLLALSVRD